MFETVGNNSVYNRQLTVVRNYNITLRNTHSQMLKLFCFFFRTGKTYLCMPRQTLGEMKSVSTKSSDGDVDATTDRIDSTGSYDQVGISVAVYSEYTRC